ncbi:polyprenyl synthetase family protein [Niastella caeni]|uniref:Polyprenyl synthetase family protein n=1 Tax=Niastella caeni TaxID=2569763 RepID=A0A4S8HTH1_9BACT|nr:polyprenyl synthetase family protein [Niastella caeni]THU38331.1 polyprenyl synthetase family protein [Niastella caeni]
MDNDKYEIDVPRAILYAGDKGKANPLYHILDNLLGPDMVRFDEELTTALEPQARHLTDTEHQIYKRGKKIRPVMLLLSARLIRGEEELSHKIIKASASLEMLHVATLIHDDIIDDALLRRGLSSVNAKRGTNAAILVGDLQFVQAIRTFVDAVETNSEMGLVKMVLDTAFNICTGELDELETDPNWNLVALRQRYFDVIERKTAIMFGLACETGMSLAKSHTGEARRLGFYGRRVGRAFQIMDDLFDFLQDEKDSGKQVGIDLVRRRVTLPIIYAMEELGAAHPVSSIIRGEMQPPDDLRNEIRAIKSTQAIERSYADARHEALDALEYLKHFPKNRYRDALEEIALYTVDRKI